MTRDRTPRRADVLVVGATGLQGGAVARALVGAGHRVTALVRDVGTDASRLLADHGVALVRGDMEDVASLHGACAGRDTVFSMQMPAGPADPGLERRTAGNLLAAAQAAGVRQVIHTSVSGTGWRRRDPRLAADLAGPGYDGLTRYFDGKEDAEQAVRDSGVDTWTILKPAFYMENLLPPKVDVMFPDLRAGELLVAASPRTPLALITADDLAHAALAAVADPARFHGAEIELAGDVLTAEGIGAVLSGAAGREITAVSLTASEASARGVRGVAANQAWVERLGYPARPHHAAEHDLATTTFGRWAARQDWTFID